MSTPAGSVKFTPLDDDFKTSDLSSLTPEQLREVNKMFIDCNKLMKEIISKARSKLVGIDKYEASLREVNGLMTLAPAQEIFERCKDKFYAARVQIVERNADFFISHDYSDVIKRDFRQRFLESIIESILFLWKRKLSDAEKDELWEKIQSILMLILRYKKMVREYE
jgi:hypothetical protein